MKKFAFVLAAAGLVSLTACSDPCGEMKDCCVAVVDMTDWSTLDPTGAMKASAQATCDAYDDADDDACQEAIDAFTAPAGADLPDECDF